MDLCVRMLLSGFWLFANPGTVACQALLSMGFSRQEYWSGSSFPSPGDLHNPGIKPLSRALAGRFFTTEPPGKPSQFPGTATKLWILTSWPFPFWWSGLLHLFFCQSSGCPCMSTSVCVAPGAPENDSGPPPRREQGWARLSPRS